MWEKAAKIIDEKLQVTKDALVIETEAVVHAKNIPDDMHNNIEDLKK
jgi:hypothetical protein